MNSANDYGKLEQTAPGMLGALSKWSKPAQRSPLDDEEQAPLPEPEERKFSNYRTDDGYQLPKGMPMMGDEPPVETVEEYLIKNGARDIVGKDPYQEAWQKTVGDWEGWFDVLGGEKQPFNPNFRNVYGKKFDDDLKQNQAAALAERNKGMEKITNLLNQRQPAYDQEGTPTPNATGNDVLKGLGVKGLPGAPEPMDYQGGIKDSTGKEQEKAAKEEDRRLYREKLQTDKEGKAKATEEAKLISTHTSRVSNTYAAMKSDAQRKLRDYGAKLNAAEKHIANEEEGWDGYAESYRQSIQNMTDFIDNIQTYKDLDIDAISRLEAPPNIQKVQDYWKKGIVKYRAGGAAVPGLVDEE
jgi:hypothetical protein